MANSNESPLLYNCGMVRALLRDTDPKSQTRRVVTHLRGFSKISEFGRSDTKGYDWHFRDRDMRWHDITNTQLLSCCPYGLLGDRIWVREPWRMPVELDEMCASDIELRTTCIANRSCLELPVYYEADGARRNWAPISDLPLGRRRHARFMPRWASRILLEITAIRVERLQQISYSDAIAEGARRFDDIPIGLPTRYGAPPRWSMEDNPKNTDHCLDSPIWAFANYWIKMRGGEPGLNQESWDTDPWVWVINFRRIDNYAQAGA